MRKKRGHLILIDGVNYIWSVKPLSYDNLLLRVQLAEQRSRGVLQVRIFSLQNFWVERDLPVTPKLVRIIIDTARANGWQPEQVTRPINYAWKNEKLIPIENATVADDITSET